MGITATPSFRGPGEPESTELQISGSPFRSTSAHPGMTNLVGMALSGSCERVDEIRITESVDCSTYESAETQTAMGFSQDPDTPGLAENVRRESEVFAESAAMMADAIGATLDKITFDVTFTAATADSDLGFMKIPAGTVGGDASDGSVPFPARRSAPPSNRTRAASAPAGA